MSVRSLNFQDQGEIFSSEDLPQSPTSQICGILGIDPAITRAQKDLIKDVFASIEKEGENKGQESALGHLKKAFDEGVARGREDMASEAQEELDSQISATFEKGFKEGSKVSESKLQHLVDAAYEKGLAEGKPVAKSFHTTGTQTIDETESQEIGVQTAIDTADQGIQVAPEKAEALSQTDFPKESENYKAVAGLAVGIAAAAAAGCTIL